jgi:hypothetical protein
MADTRIGRADMTDKPLAPDCTCLPLNRRLMAHLLKVDEGSVHEQGCVERAVAAARVAAPSDGLREAVESITRTTQRPAGRGPYVEHEVDEGHAPGEPCRFCDALAATEQPETDG